MQTSSDPHSAAGRPEFDVPVPDDGYRWWYVDGLSDDGSSGIVVIAFVGSVFSPYYYAARARGATDPEQHVAINIGLYRPDGKRWAMTERSRSALERQRDSFSVGPSHMVWVGDELHINIRERSTPFALPVEGRIVVRPERIGQQRFPLDASGRHTWQPVAPVARIEVAMKRPSWYWQGNAYLDTNAGERPLEDDFHSWHWSRGTSRGRTTIDYSIKGRRGESQSLSLAFAADGNWQSMPVPPLINLPASGWRITRQTRCDAVPVVERTLEDTPFYARSLLTVDEGSAKRHLMHESLSLDRFTRSWVRTLLPFRMPRRRA